MMYAVKEAFLTLQGEGMQAGSRAVFLRFAGCNLWSGREADRAEAICTFCTLTLSAPTGLAGASSPRLRRLRRRSQGCGASRVWRGWW